MTEQTTGDAPARSGQVQDSLAIRSQVQRVARRWRLLAVVWAGVFALSLLVALLLPADRTASAEVRINPPSAGSSSASSQEVAAERKVAASVPVSQRYAEQTQTGLSAAEARAQTEIGGEADGAVLTFEATAPTEEEALDLANGMADAYLQVRSEQLRQDREELVARLDAMLAELPEGTSPGQRQGSELNQLKAQANASTDQIGRVISPATEASGAGAKIRLAVAAAGLLGGLMLGIAVAAVAERFTPRVGFPDRVADPELPRPVTVHIRRLTQDAELLLRRLHREGHDRLEHQPVVVVALSQDSNTALRLTQALAELNPGGAEAVITPELEVQDAELIDHAAGVLLLCSSKTRRGDYQELRRQLTETNGLEGLTVFCR